MASDTLEEQVIEMQLIAAMYPEQLTFFDPVLSEIVRSADPVQDLANKRSFLLSDVAVEFIFTLRDPLGPPLELQFALPAGYPSTADSRLEAHLRLLDVSITSAVLKQCQLAANAKLKAFIADTGECNVLSVIQWTEQYRETLAKEVARLQEELKHKQMPDSSDDSITTGLGHCRLWIFSHHIYCNNKRRLICELAGQLNLCGFSRPGKPGFICVEGAEKDCDDYWYRLRAENWQRLSKIAKELDIEETKIFTSKFQELPLDQSEFIKYLEQNSCDKIVRDYLGWS